VALSAINAVRASQQLDALGLDRMVAERLIEYVEFPRALHGKYQCFTRANLDNLRAAGCDHTFADVGKGVAAYVERLLAGGSQAAVAA
jgi:ADP-L-glycero-D-manno-heptose 6-epimerase